MSYDNTNRGSIWKNDRKTKDTHPDFTGTLNVEGREYFFDAWRRKDGAPAKSPALTFRIKPKDEAPGGHPERFKDQPRARARARESVAPEQPRDDLDSEIPF